MADAKALAMLAAALAIAAPGLVATWGRAPAVRAPPDAAPACGDAWTVANSGLVFAVPVEVPACGDSVMLLKLPTAPPPPEPEPDAATREALVNAALRLAEAATDAWATPIASPGMLAVINAVPLAVPRLP